MRRPLDTSESGISKRGASLVEVVVAMFLLGLFMLFSLQPLVTSNRALSLNGNRQEREFLANQLLERASLLNQHELRSESGVGYSLAERRERNDCNIKWELTVTRLSERAVRLVIEVRDESDETTRREAVRYLPEVPNRD